ncbi:metal ABC transporter permease [bacterium]|jgi:zinc transport system permease protein|nr:metal ABC transporter permease [bacterium]
MNFITIFQYGFIQRAIITGIFVALLCSTLGLFLVLRRLSLIGDGLAHISFGGVALGLFLGVFPIYTAIPIVIIGALIILALMDKIKIYGDAAIGVISSVGIAGGVILAGISNGFNVDLLSYLFGNILAISTGEMYLSIVLSVVVLLAISFFYYDLFSITFNEEYARVAGVRVKVINVMLVVLTAITVVLSIRVVGIMLISAFIILPSVTALQIAKGFKSAIIVSTITSVIAVILGIIVSFILNIPTGAMIVVVNFIFLLFAIGYKKIASR